MLAAVQTTDEQLIAPLYLMRISASKSLVGQLQLKTALLTSKNHITMLTTEKQLSVCMMGTSGNNDPAHVQKH